MYYRTGVSEPRAIYLQALDIPQRTDTQQMMLLNQVSRVTSKTCRVRGYKDPLETPAEQFQPRHYYIILVYIPFYLHASESVRGVS